MATGFLSRGTAAPRSGSPFADFAVAFRTRYGEIEACAISHSKMDARSPGRCRTSMLYKGNLKKSCQVNGLNRFKAPSTNASGTSNPRRDGRNSLPASAKSFPQQQRRPHPQRRPLQSPEALPVSTGFSLFQTWPYTSWFGQEFSERTLEPLPLCANCL